MLNRMNEMPISERFPAAVALFGAANDEVSGSSEERAIAILKSHGHLNASPSDLLGFKGEKAEYVAHVAVAPSRAKPRKTEEAKDEAKPN